MLFAILIIVVSFWVALIYGEVEASKEEKGITFEKNIVYVHVPSAICTAICFVVLLVAGVVYLRSEREIWDYVGGASAEVGLVFATVLNATGSIFSYPFWSKWWTPSPRLVSSAILWFLCVAYLILRSSIQNRRQRARICAVFGIIAFLDVPIVFITARMMPDMHIANVEFETVWQSAAFGGGIVGILMLAGVLIWLKTDILRCRAKLENELMN